MTDKRDEPTTLRDAFLAGLELGESGDVAKFDSFDAAADDFERSVRTIEDSPSELHWLRGNRAAWTSMLSTALRELGYEDTEATRARWAVEREAAIRALRSICETHGDNNWQVDLCLEDVIDKHLGCYLEESPHRMTDEERAVVTAARAHVATGAKRRLEGTLYVTSAEISGALVSIADRVFPRKAGR